MIPSNLIDVTFQSLNTSISEYVFYFEIFIFKSLFQSNFEM